MIRTLEVTQSIWAGLADGSMEATKASNILDIMLERIKKPQPPAAEASSPTGQVPMRTDLFTSTAELQPEHSAAMTLGMLSGNVSPNTAAAFGSIQSPGGSAYPNPMDLGIPSSAVEPTSGLPDFSASIFGMGGLGGNPGSPFSTMFGALAAEPNPMEFVSSSNFDWVSDKHS
jgi:hypothetical protein